MLSAAAAAAAAATSAIAITTPITATPALANALAPAAATRWLRRLLRHAIAGKRVELHLRMEGLPCLQRMRHSPDTSIAASTATRAGSKYSAAAVAVASATSFTAPFTTARLVRLPH